MAGRYVTIMVGVHKGKRALVIRIVADDYVVRVDGSKENLYYKKKDLHFN